jgi:hypothetical protein
MCPGVMLTLVVCKIFLAGVPLKRINILCHFVPNPEISHFHRSGALAFNGVVRDADSSCIITMYWCFWLGVAEVLKGESKYDSLFTVHEKGAEFSLCCRRHDETEDRTQCVEGAIQFYGSVIFWHPSHEEMSASPTSRFGFSEVRCIRMYVEDHIRRPEFHRGIGVRGEVI